VTDHRIGLTLYRLESVLEGELDEIIDALTTHYQTEALKREGENFKSGARNPRLPKNLFGGQAKFEANANVRNHNASNKKV
jgi:hypothetical protein